MHKVIVGLYFVNRGELLEVLFDTRLTFEENMILVLGMLDYSVEEFEIYDPMKNFFMNKKRTPEDYNCQGYHLYHVFENGGAC